MKWFAWYPVKLTSGKYAWLKVVTRQWNDSINSWADVSGYSGYDGGWEYD